MYTYIYIVYLCSKSLSKLTATNNLTQPLKMTSEMVETSWARIQYFLHHLDPDVRKITRKLERLH